MTDLWPLNQIYDGSRSHLQFTSVSIFGHVTIFWLYQVQLENGNLFIFYQI